MAFSSKKLASIQVLYETGNVSITNVAKQHKISRETVTRIAKRHGWQRGKSHKKVTKTILKKAEDKFITNESDRLARFTENHIKQMNLVRQLTTLNISDMATLAKEYKKAKKTISRDRSEDFFAFQKVCKIASETLTNCYREERLAMGLDKEQNEKQPIIKIVNYADADDSL